MESKKSSGSGGKSASHSSASRSSSSRSSTSHSSSSSSASSVKAELDLNFLRQCIRDLREALKSGGQESEETISNCFSAISSRLQEYRLSGQAGQSADAKQIFNESIDTLKQAAQMGYDDAKRLLSRMGVSGSSTSSY